MARHRMKDDDFHKLIIAVANSFVPGHVHLKDMGQLMAAMRLNVPVIFVSGGLMEAGKTKLLDLGLDLVDAMVMAADDSVDE